MKNSVFRIFTAVGVLIGLGAVIIHPALGLRPFIKKVLGEGKGSPMEHGLTTALPEKADRIVVRKSERKLTLFHKGQVIKHYQISLGFQPEGAKEKEGDGKTPEGIYSISGRNPNSGYHLALRVDYPRKKDREHALQNGFEPGGDIMIHGLPNGNSLPAWTYKKRDWTLGCIAVDNQEIEEIWQAVDNGTEIEILP